MWQIAGDVGKTATKLALYDTEALVRAVRLPTPVALRDEHDAAQLGATFADGVAQLQVDDRPVEFAVGIAGLLARPHLGAAFVAAVTRRVGVARSVLASDIVVAHLASLKGELGTVLVAGTGATAMGLAPEGPPVFRDGHGPAFGDEGSGGWIGTRAVRAVVLAAESRARSTALSERIASHSGLGLQKLLLEGSASANPARWAAQFAPLVLDEWQRGDAVADAIVVEALDRLASTVVAASPSEGVRFGVVGGLVEHRAFGGELARRIEGQIPGARVTIGGDPLQGALRLLRLPEMPAATPLQQIVLSFE